MVRVLVWAAFFMTTNGIIVTDEEEQPSIFGGGSGLLFDGHDDKSLIDYYEHPKYTFKYGVEDPSTGDMKRVYESRDGDSVSGEYSFMDSDGSIRTVRYVADSDGGFRAIVRRLHGSYGDFYSLPDDETEIDSHYL